MDTEGLSVICAGLGIAEEDENGNRIGYIKGEYCLGIPSIHALHNSPFGLLENVRILRRKNESREFNYSCFFL